MNEVVQDICAALFGASAAFLWTLMFVGLVRRGKLTSAQSRKAIHITTGPLFLATLPLYTESRRAQVFAALVPGSFAVRLLLCGVGVTPSDPLGMAVARGTGKQKEKLEPVESMSSTHQSNTTGVVEALNYSNGKERLPNENSFPHGAAKEAAGGPFWYATVVSLITLISWRSNGSTFVAILMMAFGDGFAELGSLYSIRPWPLPRSWKRKSLGGSAIFFITGFSGAWAYVEVFSRAGYCDPIGVDTIAAASLMSTLAEILPFEDNIAVPVTAYAVSAALSGRTRY